MDLYSLEALCIPRVGIISCGDVLLRYNNIILVLEETALCGKWGKCNWGYDNYPGRSRNYPEKRNMRRQQTRLLNPGQTSQLEPHMPILAPLWLTLAQFLANLAASSAVSVQILAPSWLTLVQLTAKLAALRPSLWRCPRKCRFHHILECQHERLVDISVHTQACR